MFTVGKMFNKCYYKQDKFYGVETLVTKILDLWVRTGIGRNATTASTYRTHNIYL